jgi:hypothetical protein
VFVAFPNEATFADCKGGEIAQVLTDNVMLPDYDFIPGHEFTSSLYRTDAKQSWSGETYSGIKCTCWFQRKAENDFYNIVVPVFALTSLLMCVWTFKPVADLVARVSNRAREKGVHLNLLGVFLPQLYRLHGAYWRSRTTSA